MSEAVGSAPVPSYGGLQGAHMLRASDGGGVVFPFGFFGPVYHLPEWEFIRYAAYIDHLQAGFSALTGWKRFLRGQSNARQFLIFLTIAGGVFALTSSGMVNRGYLFSVAIASIAGSTYFALAQIHLTHQAKFREAFPSATRLPLYAHWWTHALAALVVLRKVDCLKLVWRCLIHAFLGWLLFLMSDSLHPLIIAAAIPALALHIAQPPIMLASFAFLRLRLGRPPMADDLQPVAAPDRSVSA